MCIGTGSRSLQWNTSFSACIWKMCSTRDVLEDMVVKILDNSLLDGEQKRIIRLARLSEACLLRFKSHELLFGNPSAPNFSFELLIFCVHL